MREIFIGHKATRKNFVLVRREDPQAATVKEILTVRRKNEAACRIGHVGNTKGLQGQQRLQTDVPHVSDVLSVEAQAA